MQSIKRPLRLLAMVACVLAVASASAASFTVGMNNFTFSPAVLTITVGDTVTWTNTGAAGNHTATSGDTNLCTSNPFWHTGNQTPHTTVSITFTNITPNTYTYICTNHCTVQHMIGRLIINAAPNTPPTVSLDAPANNAKFRAPTNLLLQATAADPGGSVTNVTFLSSGSPVGNDNTGPFSLTLNNLGAGNYSLRAVATDNGGLSTTSSVVSVFVLTNALLSPPADPSASQFQFTVAGIAGQTYVTETSTNLTNWISILTNLAPANVFNVTDVTSTNVLQVYRTRQDLF